MKSANHFNGLAQLMRLMSEKNVTPQRLAELLSSGILADILDPEADISCFRRADVRAVLRMEAGPEPTDAQQKDFQLRYVLGNVEDRRSVLLQIERILSTPLLSLASDEKSLDEALSRLNLLPMKNRLRRSGIVSEFSVENRDVEAMRSELGRHVRAYHLLCVLFNINPNEDWVDHSIFELLPPFDSDEELKSLIFERFKITQFAILEAEYLLRELGLDFTESELQALLKHG